MPIALAYREFCPNIVRHNRVDIGKAHQLLGYEPTQHRIGDGIAAAMPWYIRSVVSQ